MATLSGVLILGLCASITLAQEIILGQGDFRYAYVPEKLQLPASVSLANAHGLARSMDGSIFLTYESKSVNKDTRALARFTPDGNNCTLVGPDNALAAGTPHGLRISNENGVEYLYHSNNAHTVTKTTLDGRILWTKDETSLWEGTPFWPFNPTDAFVPPVGAPKRDLFVTDGYGKGYVHDLNIATGQYQNFSFGGPGDSPAGAPPKFNCPHGINYDPRRNLIVVCDRANHRLMYINFDGSFNSTNTMPENASLPCNVDFGFDKTHALVPSLGAADSDGSVAILDADNQVVSVLMIAEVLASKGQVHPHDAIFLPNGDIVVCFWNPGALSYWRLLPKQAV